MSMLHAIIMGLVQGLTEFLPVSSSAHLVFADHFLHLHLTEMETISFDVLLHLGTLVAVLVYFRTDVLALLGGAWRLIRRPCGAWQDAYTRLFVLLLLGTIPAGIAYVTLKEYLEQVFQNVPGTAALLLMTAAMLLWIARRPTGVRTLASTTWRDALLIGVFQAVAILPGVSRSGSTLTAGLLRGLDRDAAPRFSFLLAIPVILAGGLIDFTKTLEAGFSIPPAPLAAGFIAATVSGYCAVVLLLNIVRTGRLDRFAYYCIAAGLGMLLYWHFLVPKIDVRTIGGVAGTQPIALNDEGIVGPVEIGLPMTLSLAVDPGMVPVQRVYAWLPNTDGAHHHIREMNFTAPAGGGRCISEPYIWRIPGAPATMSPQGEMRDIWVIIRNAWGIQNEVRVRVHLLPESPSRRMG